MSIDFTRLRSQFESSPNLRALIDSMFGPIDDLTVTTENVRTKTDLGNAVGVQQDRN